MQSRITTSAMLALATLLAFCPHLAAQVESNLPEAGFDTPTIPSPQTPQPAAPESESNAPTLHVNARETIVDITVSNDAGQPVYGLQRSDFTVSEDGKPQPVRSFGEYSLGTSAATRVHTNLPSGVYTNDQAVPTTGPVNMLLIDALNTDPALVAHEQQEIVKYLNAMPAGTQVAIFTLSANGLEVLQGFTSNTSLLLRSMDTNFLVLGTNANTENVRRDWTTIDALDKIAAYVAGIKGRKNLLWFTPGMPILLTRDGGYGWGDGDLTRVHRIMDTYERFAAEQIAVSPVDPIGSSRLSGRQLRMEAVAEDTGGVAYYENNDLKSLIGKAIDDGSHFYTISYIPPRQKDDGHYHKISIQVDHPGLHLVYRTGYDAEETPPIHLPAGHALMQASLEGQAPVATQLLFDVRVQPVPDSAVASVTRTSGRRTLAVPGKTLTPYDFVFSIPSSQLTFADGPGNTHNGSIEFDVAAFDVNGKLVGNEGQTMLFPLSQAEYQQFIQTPFQFFQHLDLPPGKVFLRLGILDNVSNKVGTLDIPLVVPKLPAQRPIQ